MVAIVQRLGYLVVIQGMRFRDPLVTLSSVYGVSESNSAGQLHLSWTEKLIRDDIANRTLRTVAQRQSARLISGRSWFQDPPVRL